ncbi:MAG TPA: helix-turn-helix transcriptional regulator [Pseudonocardiaceae bacterium]|jgi:transcriptional regulator with XRE-family HTH domain|nr:helix-turn-helix transcriptional regulator [Pseudonocardiaceae bacterium]
MTAKENGPNVRQRRVARALRKWRESTGQKLLPVASRLRWSESKLSRFERAEVNAGPAEVIALAAILGIDDTTRDKIVELAINATEIEDHWGVYGPAALRGDFKDFVEDESEATQVRTMESVLVTGLLQTADYADALLRGGWEPNVSEAVVAERSSLRQQRQARLDYPADPLRLHTILYEQALRLPIAKPAVMRAQLEHLVERAKLRHVTVQVLPLSVGAYPGIGTSYHLIEFDPEEAGAVYLENLQDGLYIEEEDDIAAYTLNFERLRKLALSPKASAQRIGEISRSWT